MSIVVAAGAFAAGALIGPPPTLTAALTAVVIALVTAMGRRRRRRSIDRDAVRFVAAQFALVGAVTLAVAQLVPYGAAGKAETGG